MSRLLVWLPCLLALCSRTIAADPSPIVTTITVQTTSESLTTFTSTGVSTSIFQNALTTFVTTVRGKVQTTVSTLEDQTSLIPYTSTGVSTITVNTNTVIVSTVGLSTATSSDDPATKTAVPASTTTSSSSVTNPPSLSTSTSDASSTSTDTQSTLTQATSQSSETTSSSTASKASPTSSVTPSTAPHYTQPKAELTSGQKAGIGVGVALGVVVLLVLIAVIILWRHGLLSRKAHVEDVFDDNEDFLHRPYSMLFSQKKQIEVHHEKPEEATHHPAYGSNARLSNPKDMSGTTIHEHPDEGPVYLAVPAHMSGAHRWSKVQQGEE